MIHHLHGCKHLKLFVLILALAIFASLTPAANGFCLIEDFDSIPSFPYGHWQATDNIPVIENGTVKYDGNSGLIWYDNYHAVYAPHGMTIELGG
ncbi:MAG: hypothetical protein ABIK28_10740 [Planctomycetota bacterium]